MRKKFVIVLNILMVACLVAGLVIMVMHNGTEQELVASNGLENLKFYTVLSNIFCGVIAAVFLLLRGKTPGWLMTLKLAAAASVAVTFLVVAGFLGPLYGYRYMYLGSNFFFHLTLPLLGMIEFCLLEKTISFQKTFLASIPTVLYGCVYLGNILINGTGEWPGTNDWYGFYLWGLGVALVIFAAIVLISWGVACLLRFINLRVNQPAKNQ
ncbi:MAG: hypothetical protein IJL09_10080 [Lachnospiraceae bacterium]|nr:hypothetical protein [Lachnospiraceae bacterium]